MQYVAATADTGLLDEVVPFLEGRLLKADEHEAYEQPVISRQTASIYEHCVRAIALNLSTGEHGLPYMGTGDWNDGMSLVGSGGKGESVWLGWFLLSILRPFADIAAARGEVDRAETYRRGTRQRSRARSSRRGTANGTGEPTSTMERRSDRRRTRSAASTRSRSRGPSSPAARITRARARPWSPPIGIS